MIASDVKIIVETIAVISVLAGTSIQYSISADSTELTINNVCKSCTGLGWTTDLMVVQCNASNSFGYAFAEGYLNVLREWLPND